VEELEGNNSELEKQLESLNKNVVKMENED
jgi:hypothetical protein